MKTMETKRTKHISRRFRRFARANEAVSALEYAILVGVIAVGMAAALAAFESEIQTALDHHWRPRLAAPHTPPHLMPTDSICATQT